MHQSSLEKMQGFVDTHLADARSRPLTIYDVGSYDVNGTYKPFFEHPGWRYVGIDQAAGPNVDIVLSQPYRWAGVPSQSADVIVSGQAFEHIELFWMTMLEVERVLKPGGLCCILVPAAGQEHRYPVDCWRYYPDGLRALATYAGLETVVAETDWTPRTYEDGSEEWKDSTLVARKPDLNPLRRLRRSLRRRLIQAGMALAT